MIIPGESFLLVFCQNPILHSEVVHIYVFHSVKPGLAFKFILIYKILFFSCKNFLFSLMFLFFRLQKVQY